jgi:hypothetical protein
MRFQNLTLSTPYVILHIKYSISRPEDGDLNHRNMLLNKINYHTVILAGSMQLLSCTTHNGMIQYKVLFTYILLYDTLYDTGKPFFRNVTKFSLALENTDVFFLGSVSGQF